MMGTILRCIKNLLEQLPDFAKVNPTATSFGLVLFNIFISDSQKDG